MSASQNILSLVLSQQDSNGVDILKPRQVGPISYSGSVGQFNDVILTGTGSTTVNFPIGLTTAYQMYFRNTMTGSTGFITVSATPLAATGSVILGKIGPGASLISWSPITGSSGGYSAASVQADTSGCTFEYFIGG